MRKTLLLVLFFATSLWMNAISLNFESGKKYRIECQLYNVGTLTIGAQHEKKPMIYYDKSSSIVADGWWYVDGDSNTGYVFKNASTGQYLQYTDERNTDGSVGAAVKYMTLSDANTGNATKWTLDGSGNQFAIINVATTSACINVRTDGTFLVGTYSYSADRGVDANSLFTFYDESGEALSSDDGPTQSDEETGKQVAGTTSNGEYWENTGLSVPIVYTTNTSNPVYYTIKNVRTSKYVSYTSSQQGGGRPGASSSSTTQLTLGTSATQFYFLKGTNGVNVYTKDGKYVSGVLPTIFDNVDATDENFSSSLAAILLNSGTTAITNNTWKIDYYANENAGYGLGISICSNNNSSNSALQNGYVYWNDYTAMSSNSFSQISGLGYYTLDGGSTFVFYSSDSRHKEYLEKQGIKLDGSMVQMQGLSKYLTDLKINGKTIAYDNYYQQYMLPVSHQYIDNDDYSAIVTFSQKEDGTNYKLCIGNDSISSGEKYTFKDYGADKPIKLSVKAASEILASSNMAVTYMPVVQITLSSCNSSYYTTGSIRVNNPETNTLDSLYVTKFKYRGATASGLPKKSYALKLVDDKGYSIDRGLLGDNFREDNNWILDAMGIDRSRMRNRVSTDLWVSFTSKPYYASKEKKLIPATRGKFVEVLLNGSYLGTYCMTEKIDRKQLKLKKYIDPTGTASDTIRGVLYKTSQWSYETLLGHSIDRQPDLNTSLSHYDNSVDTWANTIEAKYPDLDDNQRLDWSPLYNAVKLVANGSDSEFKSGVETYFDTPVWRDYYLFIELMLATDNHGKNMYLFNYNIQDSKDGKKISLAPWDLDGTWGIRWDGSTTYTSDATQDFDTFIWDYEHGQLNYFIRMKKLDYNSFNTQLATRYAELRKTDFLEANLVQRFTTYADLYAKSGALGRERSRWASDANNSSTYFKSISDDNDLSYLKSWIHSRLATLDYQYNYSSKGDPSTPTTVGISQPKNNYLNVAGGKNSIYVKTMVPSTIVIRTFDGRMVHKYDMLAGQQVLTGYTPGVYLVNTKKVVVK